MLSLSTYYMFLEGHKRIKQTSKQNILVRWSLFKEIFGLLDMKERLEPERFSKKLEYASLDGSDLIRRPHQIVQKLHRVKSPLKVTLYW